jgi:hypothetical protein
VALFLSEQANNICTITIKLIRMNTFKAAIDQFFRDYEKTFQDFLNGEDADVKQVSASFADYFVGANPQGVMGAKNDETFTASIPAVYDRYRKTGALSMTIGEQTVTIFDEWHAMVKVHWFSEYLRKDGEKIPIDFEVIYFLQKLEEAPKIFAFIGGDEEKVLKENGLLPE